MEPEWHNFKNGTWSGNGRFHDCPEFDCCVETEDFVVFVARNGTKHVRWGCFECHGMSSTDFPHKSVNIDDLPVVVDYRTEYCERCGELGAELHHWAPSYKFDDSWDWPTSYLCIQCHRYWHKTMDPGTFK